MNDDAALYALTAQGREALKLLDRDAAEALFRQALAERRVFVDALVGLGQVAYERGQLEDAERHFAKAFALSKQQAGGSWPQRLRLTDDHERSFLRAIHGMGLVRFRQGRGQEALEYFQLEQRLDPADHQGSRFLIRQIRAGGKWRDTSK